MKTIVGVCATLAGIAGIFAACSGTVGGGGVPCGNTTCNAGETCCSTCGGAPSCSQGGCEEFACPADAAPFDAPEDAPSDALRDAPSDALRDAPSDAPSEVGPDASCEGAACPVACRSTADCAGAGYCSGPEDPPCMGACNPPQTCTSDVQCTGGTVCRDGAGVAGCGPSLGPLFCLAPCTTDGECHAWEQCSTGHCQPRPCSTCPSYLSCASGVCAATSCTSDANCPQGFCVNGFCYGSLGVCMGLCG